MIRSNVENDKQTLCEAYFKVGSRPGSRVSFFYSAKKPKTNPPVAGLDPTSVRNACQQAAPDTAKSIKAKHAEFIAFYPLRRTCGIEQFQKLAAPSPSRSRALNRAYGARQPRKNK